MVQLHDTGYKYLFSHADLVRELLEVFAPPGVAEWLDYATLRPETGNFITPAMKKREDDVVWSIELQGQRVYLYLLLEFQSAIDKGMPVRMMQYVAALYDHLVRSKAIDLANGLPPVLPMVIYNGDARWNGCTQIFDLIQPHPAELTAFQPKLKDRVGQSRTDRSLVRRRHQRTASCRRVHPDAELTRAFQEMVSPLERPNQGVPSGRKSLLPTARILHNP